jgi:hypothetical protein
MELHLNFEQRARVELIAIHSGKPPAQILVDAAQFLLNCETDYFPPSPKPRSQQFLSEDALARRFARLLHH